VKWKKGTHPDHVVGSAGGQSIGAGMHMGGKHRLAIMPGDLKYIDLHAVNTDRAPITGHEVLVFVLAPSVLLNFCFCCQNLPLCFIKQQTGVW
jgi:hypothetical protein